MSPLDDDPQSGLSRYELELRKTETRYHILSPALSTPGFETRRKEPDLREPSLHNDKQHATHHRISPHSFPFLFNHHLYETLSIVSSILAIIATIVVLHTCDGQLVQEWP